ncbi:unnamed protein product, partial [Rotaria socialis]
SEPDFAVESELSRVSNAKPTTAATTQPAVASKLHAPPSERLIGTVSDPKTHAILKPEESPPSNSKLPVASEAHPPPTSEKNAVPTSKSKPPHLSAEQETPSSEVQPVA